MPRQHLSCRKAFSTKTLLLMTWLILVILQTFKVLGVEGPDKAWKLVEAARKTYQKQKG
jgi:hypothetical protein